MLDLIRIPIIVAVYLAPTIIAVLYFRYRVKPLERNLFDLRKEFSRLLKDRGLSSIPTGQSEQKQCIHTPLAEKQPTPKVEAVNFAKQEAAESKAEETPALRPYPTQRPDEYTRISESTPKKDLKKPKTLEERLGLKALIWVGGLALTFAGFFLVKLSIEHGLMTPIMRIISGFGFATILGVFAEVFLRKNKEKSISCALMGAAIAVGMGTFFAASQFYALIPPHAGIAGFVGLSVFGIFASKRFGWQISLLALVGIFVAPLVLSVENPSSPVLLSYLFVMTVGLLSVFYSQKNYLLSAGVFAANILWGLFWLIKFNSSQDATGVFQIWLIAETVCFIIFAFLARKQIRKGEDWHIEGKDIFMLFAHIPMALTTIAIALTTVLGSLMWYSEHILLYCIPTFIICALYFALSLFEKEFRKTLWLCPLLCALLISIFFLGDDDSYMLSVFGVWLAVSAIASVKLKNASIYPFCFGVSAIFFAIPFIFGPISACKLVALFAVAALPQIFCAIKNVKENLRAQQWLTLCSFVIFIFFAKCAAAFEFLPGLPIILVFFALCTLKLDIRLVRIPIIFFSLLSLLVYGERMGLKYMLSAVWGGNSTLIPGASTFCDVFSLLAVFAGIAIFFQLRAKKDVITEFIWACVLPSALLFAVISASKIFNTSYPATYFSSAAIGFSSMLAAMLMLFAYNKLGRSASENLACIAVLIGFIRFFFAAFADHNPFMENIWVEGVHLFNAFMVSLLAPGIVLAASLAIMGKTDKLKLTLRKLLFISSLILIFAWVNSQVAFAFKGNLLFTATSRAEFYAYSVVWLAWSLLLFGAGYALKNTALRVCALLFINATAVKIFIFDSSELDGLMRALSFAMLGVCLIGIGWFYMKYVLRKNDSELTE